MSFGSKRVPNSQYLEVQTQLVEAVEAQEKMREELKMMKEDVQKLQVLATTIATMLNEEKEEKKHLKRKYSDLKGYCSEMEEVWKTANQRFEELAKQEHEKHVEELEKRMRLEHFLMIRGQIDEFDHWSAVQVGYTERYYDF